MNALVSADSINLLLVFAEGLLSFFSPCVIPLIPIYVGYLSGSAGHDAGTPFPRRKVFAHTVFFVLGISFAFFILGMSFTALGTFFQHNKALFSRIGGIVIFLLGLSQIGFFEIPFLQRERRFHLPARFRRVNPFIAFIMGFTFSFAWTPCVGPALSSVLIMASGARTKALGNLLVLVYALGFVIPFLLLGLFTAQVLRFIERNKKLMRYTIKAGGVLLMLIGLMTFTGWMNGITGYLSSASNPSGASSGQSAVPPQDAQENSGAPSSATQPPKEESEVLPAFDFTLTDQYGTQHTLSDYKGKVVFLNFWATWCPPCKTEMPHIGQLYQEYGQNTGDVVFLGVANPQTEEAPYNADVKQEEIERFLTDNSLTFPVVFDTTSDVFLDYQINSFPTTFMIDRDGNIYGYVSGGLTKDMMKSIIEQTLQGDAQ